MHQLGESVTSRASLAAHGTPGQELSQQAPMPTEARGNYLPEPPYLRETKTCCRSYVKLLDY